MKTPGEWMPRSKAISDAKTRQQLTQPTRSAVRATNGRGRGWFRACGRAGRGFLHRPRPCAASAVEEDVMRSFFRSGSSPAAFAASTAQCASNDPHDSSKSQK